MKKIICLLIVFALVLIVPGVTHVDKMNDLIIINENPYKDRTFDLNDNAQLIEYIREEDRLIEEYYQAKIYREG